MGYLEDQQRWEVAEALGDLTAVLLVLAVRWLRRTIAESRKDRQPPAAPPASTSQRWTRPAPLRASTPPPPPERPEQPL